MRINAPYRAAFIFPVFTRRSNLAVLNATEIAQAAFEHCKRDRNPVFSKGMTNVFTNVPECTLAVLHKDRAPIP